MNGPRSGKNSAVREGGALVVRVNGDALAAAGLLPARLGLAAALQLQRVLQPRLVVGLVLVDVEAAAHGVMPAAAQLGSGDLPAFVLRLGAEAGGGVELGVTVGGVEPDRDGLAGQGVLLEPQVRQ